VVGVHEHDLGDRTLVEAAGRLALAQAQLDLVLRLTIDRLRYSDNPDVGNPLETETRDLCSELSSQFRARCKDPNLRTRLRAMMVACERLSDERTRLVRDAWTVAKDGAAQAGGPLLVTEPATTEALCRLAGELSALAKVIDKARQHGFIARAAAQDTAPALPVVSGEANANALAIIRLPEPPQPVKTPIENRALALTRQATVLQPRESGRLAIMVCPNCQTKVVST
jgi:hypothetical protein